MIWVSVIWSVFQVYKLLYYIQSQHCWLLVNRKLFTTTTFKPCLVLGCYCTCICCAQLPHWAMPFSFAAILHWDQSKWPVCTNKCMTILFNSLRSWVSFIAHTHTHARTHARTHTDGQWHVYHIHAWAFIQNISHILASFIVKHRFLHFRQNQSFHPNITISQVWKMLEQHKSAPQETASRKINSSHS